MLLRYIHISGSSYLHLSIPGSLISKIASVQFSSVQSLSRVWLCDPMDCSTSSLPIHCQLLEFTQTHVHRVGDAIQPSHTLLLLCTLMVELVIGFAAVLVEFTSENTPSKHLIMMVKYTFCFPASLPLLQLFFLLWKELFLNHTLLGKLFFYFIIIL